MKYRLNNQTEEQRDIVCSILQKYCIPYNVNKYLDPSLKILDIEPYLYDIQVTIDLTPKTYNFICKKVNPLLFIHSCYNKDLPIEVDLKRELNLNSSQKITVWQKILNFFKQFNTNYKHINLKGTNFDLKLVIDPFDKHTPFKFANGEYSVHLKDLIPELQNELLKQYSKEYLETKCIIKCKVVNNKVVVMVVQK